MNSKHVLCTLLHLLTLLVCCKQVHSHSHSKVAIFFLLDDLRVGNTMAIYFPKRELSDSLGHLLDKEEADSIPFSSDQLPQILHLFSFSKDSPQAMAMAATLEECDREPIQGEMKLCATSIDSMYQFLQTIFGTHTPIMPLATSHLKPSSQLQQHDGDDVNKYRIMGIKEIPSPKMVSCHTMPYAYTVLYCHYHHSDNRVYTVSLLMEDESGDDDDEVLLQAIAVCHMDTSQWGPGHVAFEVLGVGPGSTPVCHFFPADNFVWVPIM